MSTVTSIGDAHPAAVELAALAVNDVSDEDRERLAAHIADCERCGQAFKLAISMSEDSQALAEEWVAGAEEGAEPSDAGMSSTWLALAASLVLSISAVFIATNNPGNDEDLTRSGTTTVSPPNGASVAGFPQEFTWSGEQAGQIVLMNDMAEVLFRSDSVSSPWTPTDAAQAAVGDAQDLIWQVELPGSVIGPFQFSVE